MRKQNKILTRILTLLLLFCLIPTAYAANKQTTDQSSILNITAVADNHVLSNKTCKLYYIADLTGQFAQAFQKYKLKITENSLRESIALANTLNALIARDGIQPDATGQTNGYGKLVFTNLKPGIWLLISDDSDYKDVTYKAQPSIFTLDPNMTLELEIKHTIEYPDITPDGPKTIRKVLKKWDRKDHPDAIYVQLLKNGRIYDEVKLSDRNNWRYTWDNLDKYADWAIVEIDVPDDWYCEITESGITTLLTNSKNTPPPDTPTKPDKPNKPADPNNPNTPDKPNNPPDENIDDNETPKADRPNLPDDFPGGPTQNKPKLPQTGTTWYHVPIFAGIGLIGLVAGLYLKKKDDKLLKLMSIIIIGFSIILIFVAGIIAGQNQNDEQYASEKSRDVLTQTTEHIHELRAIYQDYTVTPDYILDDTREMPVITIDDLNIIAQIKIPELNINLPVCEAWDAASAKKAPCRYTGSAYDNNLVIAGHSYKSHFKNLYGAEPGMTVELTDMDSNVFIYEIKSVQTIGEYEPEKLYDDTFDLALFTCTSDSRHRIVTKCELCKQY